MIYTASESPSIRRYMNPLLMAHNLWSYRYLIGQLAIREVHSRYRGSRLGLLWSFLHPLLMLSIYTFVFGVIFKARWDTRSVDSQGEFALTLFCGLVVFGIFSESVSRAPTLIVSHPNYVKKIVFPLEILPVAALISSTIFAGINISILLVMAGLITRTLSKTVYCFPLVLTPILLLSLGCGWFLASLGVFVRDVSHATGIVMQILFFMTPIFYPLAAIPEGLQWVMRINPLAVMLEEARKTLIWGMWPDWGWLALGGLVSLLVAQLGYACFMKTKRGFADVL